MRSSSVRNHQSLKTRPREDSLSSDPSPDYGPISKLKSILHSYNDEISSGQIRTIKSILSDENKSKQLQFIASLGFLKHEYSDISDHTSAKCPEIAESIIDNLIDVETYINTFQTHIESKHHDFAHDILRAAILYDHYYNDEDVINPCNPNQNNSLNLSKNNVGLVSSTWQAEANIILQNFRAYQIMLQSLFSYDFPKLSADKTTQPALEIDRFKRKTFDICERKEVFEKMCASRSQQHNLRENIATFRLDYIADYCFYSLNVGNKNSYFYSDFQEIKNIIKTLKIYHSKSESSKNNKLIRNINNLFCKVEKIKIINEHCNDNDKSSSSNFFIDFRENLKELYEKSDYLACQTLIYRTCLKLALISEKIYAEQLEIEKSNLLPKQKSFYHLIKLLKIDTFTDKIDFFKKHNTFLFADERNITLRDLIKLKNQNIDFIDNEYLQNIINNKIGIVAQEICRKIRNDQSHTKENINEDFIKKYTKTILLQALKLNYDQNIVEAEFHDSIFTYLNSKNIPVCEVGLRTIMALYNNALDNNALAEQIVETSLREITYLILEGDLDQLNQYISSHYNEYISQKARFYEFLEDKFSSQNHHERFNEYKNSSEDDNSVCEELEHSLFSPYCEKTSITYDDENNIFNEYLSRYLSELKSYIYLLEPFHGLSIQTLSDIATRQNNIKVRCVGMQERETNSQTPVISYDSINFDDFVNQIANTARLSNLMPDLNYNNFTIVSPNNPTDYCLNTNDWEKIIKICHGYSMDIFIDAVFRYTFHERKTEETIYNSACIKDLTDNDTEFRKFLQNYLYHFSSLSKYSKITSEAEESTFLICHSPNLYRTTLPYYYTQTHIKASYYYLRVATLLITRKLIRITENNEYNDYQSLLNQIIEKVKTIVNFSEERNDSLQLIDRFGELILANYFKVKEIEDNVFQFYQDITGELSKFNESLNNDQIRNAIAPFISGFSYREIAPEEQIVKLSYPKTSSFFLIYFENLKDILQFSGIHNDVDLAALFANITNIETIYQNNIATNSSNLHNIKMVPGSAHWIDSNKLTMRIACNSKKELTETLAHIKATFEFYLSQAKMIFDRYNASVAECFSNNDGISFKLLTIDQNGKPKLFKDNSNQIERENHKLETQLCQNQINLSCNKVYVYYSYPLSLKNFIDQDVSGDYVTPEWRNIFTSQHKGDNTTKRSFIEDNQVHTFFSLRNLQDKCYNHINEIVYSLKRYHKEYIDKVENNSLNSDPQDRSQYTSDESSQSTQESFRNSMQCQNNNKRTYTGDDEDIAKRTKQKFASIIIESNNHNEINPITISR